MTRRLQKTERKTLWGSNKIILSVQPDQIQCKNVFRLKIKSEFPIKNKLMV